MGLVNFKEIDFNKSINKENKIINFNGSEIQIVNYLSAQDKYDLIMITLQKSKENNIYNPYLIDLYFNLNVIYLYTNIIFDTEDRADEAELYDTLKRSGLMDAIIAEIDKDELYDLKGYIYDLTNSNHDYYNSLGYIAADFINQVGPIIQKASAFVENIDVDKINNAMILFNNKLNQNNINE